MKPVTNPFIGYKPPSVWNKGFTMTELIVTVTIVGVLAAVATPAMTNLVRNQRITSQTNELVADLNFAKSEAVKRGINIVICAAALGGGACAGTADYTNGRLIYVDTNSNGILNAGEQILRERPRLEGNLNTLRAIGGNAAPIIFSFRGITVPGGPTNFAVCDNRGANVGREIQISTTGLARTLTSGSTGYSNVCA